MAVFSFPNPGVIPRPTEFPANWRELSTLILWTRIQFNRIGFGSVTVGWIPQGGAGFNLGFFGPWGGIRINPKEFWDEDPVPGIDSLLHESYHSDQLFPLHNAAMGQLVDIPGQPPSALSKFIDRSKQFHDNNGKTLWKYMLEEAKWPK